MEDASRKYVVVHLRLGHDYADPLAQDVLDYVGDKPPEDVVFLSDQSEYDSRKDYSEKYGFPESCFHESYDGHLDSVQLSVDFFKGRVVEVMGYLFSPSGVHRCVNNASSDLAVRAKRVEVLHDLVKVKLP